MLLKSDRFLSAAFSNAPRERKQIDKQHFSEIDSVAGIRFRDSSGIVGGIIADDAYFMRPFAHCKSNEVLLGEVVYFLLQIRALRIAKIYRGFKRSPRHNRRRFVIFVFQTGNGLDEISRDSFRRMFRRDVLSRGGVYGAKPGVIKRAMFRQWVIAFAANASFAVGAFPESKLGAADAVLHAAQITRSIKPSVMRAFREKSHDR